MSVGGPTPSLYKSMLFWNFPPFEEISRHLQQRKPTEQNEVAAACGLYDFHITGWSD